MDLERFLDADKKVKVWPGKKLMKEAALEYVATKFEVGKEYNEKEINKIINEWHTFGDYFILRRGMIDMKLLKRTKDGAKYWRNSGE